MYFGKQQSGPASSAGLFYNIYLFRQAFEFLRMGYASAMAWLLFVIILILTAIQLRVSRRWVYYE
jgi:multiple sugar transport system permease protein